MRESMTLFQLLAHGDQRALEELIDIYTPSLFNLVRGIIGEEELAREILNDTYQRLWENRKTVAVMDNPSGWLYTTARYHAFNSLKKEKRKIFVQLDDQKSIPVQDNPEEEIDLKEIVQTINAAVAQLPPQKKLIYELSREEGLSRKEIAKRLNIAESTVKNQLTAALKVIRESIGKAIHISFF